MNRLFSYEATGFEPEQVTELRDHSIELENRCIQMDKAYRELAERYAALEKENEWIPVSERLPKEGEYIRISFKNFSIPVVGRYENDVFYDVDDDTTCVDYDLYVNAWKPLDKPYKESDRQ